MTHKERLREYIDYKGITGKKFCQEAKLSYGYLTHNGDLGSTKIENIASAFPDINIEWLITGNGSMLREGIALQNSEALAPQPYQEYTQQLAAKEEVIDALRGQIQTLEARILDKEALARLLQAQVLSLEKDKKNMGRN